MDLLIIFVNSTHCYPVHFLHARKENRELVVKLSTISIKNII